MNTNRDKLKLGLFMPNCSYWASISTYKPDPEDWTFDSNVEIAKAAEDAGFDFLFPIAKWRGYGGKTDYLGISLETFTWAAGILTSTEKIQVFSTVHVPVFHPVATAKMGATLDHIGKGRWGLNIVSGWSEREFSMMGIDVIEHGERYARTESYIDIIKGLWTQKPGTFDYESKWYKISGGDVQPQPTAKPHPLIANAGTSEDAKAMVAKMCDWAFLSPPSIKEAGEVVNDIKNRASSYSRRVSCACYPFVIWKDSEQEAQEIKEKLLEEMDDEATQNWANGLNKQSGSYDKHTLEMFSLGGGGIPIIGSKAQVAEMIRELYTEGMDGMLMSFLDYKKDTVRFKNELLPILRNMNIRK